MTKVFVDQPLALPGSAKYLDGAATKMVLLVIKLAMLHIFVEILNLEGHPNCRTGSRVTAVLLNCWILPIVGASAVEGLRSKGLPVPNHL